MKWVKGQKLGWGRFGVVFACSRDDEGQEVYAIKMLQTDLAQVIEVRRRFENEAEILDRLDHPNVMRVISRGETPKGIPWFVMPRADKSIKDAIANPLGVNEAWVIKTFRGVLAGVARAHEKNVLHRDLKPSNLLLKGETPLVADFGIAKQIDIDGTSLTRTAQQMGTLRYMAPEQSSNIKSIGPQADVYALGKIFAYMLTAIEPEPLVVNLADVPERFRWFIDKCCRDEPDHRFADAGVALDKFNQLMSEPEIVLPPVEHLTMLYEQANGQLGLSGETEALEAFDAELRAHSTERAVYQQVVPRIPQALLARWSEIQPHGFKQTLVTYDGHIDWSLPFAYCDTVANFLAKVYTLTDDLALKRMVIARLLEVGVSHNRWHVGDVTVDLLAILASATDVAVAEEVIDEHQHAAAWIAKQALARPIRAPIADALRRALQHEEAVGL
jgi:serine/threonine protein kinase